MRQVSQPLCALVGSVVHIGAKWYWVAARNHPNIAQKGLHGIILLKSTASSWYLPNEVEIGGPAVIVIFFYRHILKLFESHTHILVKVVLMDK